MSEQGKHKEIKLIAVDVDGTLLNSKGELTARTETALKAAMAKGVQVVLATGKTRLATQNVIERLGLTTPGVYLQGLAVYDGNGKIMQQQMLSPAVARQAITYAEDRGFVVIAYSGTRILARAANPRIAESLFTRYHEKEPEIVGALQNLIDQTTFNKLVIVGETQRITALRYQLSAQVGGTARIIQAGVPEMLEVLPPGASKGGAVKWLLKELRVPADHVLALGDAENDLEMLQLAGVGVAMGQAAQRVKDAADAVTATCDDDGVAEAVEKYVLGGGKAEPASETTVPTAAAAN